MNKRKNAASVMKPSISNAIGLYPVFFEIDDFKKVKIDGNLSLIKYDENNIVFSHRSKKIEITGRGLIISDFSYHDFTLCGEIKGINLID